MYVGAAALGCGVAVTIAFTVWIYWRGLPRISPDLAAAMYWGPAHRLISGMLLLLMLIMTAIYGIVGEVRSRERQLNLNWRSTSVLYYHERTPTIALLLLALVWEPVAYWFDVTPFIDLLLRQGRIVRWVEMALHWVLMPTQLIMAALFLLAAISIYQRFRRPPVAWQTSVAPIRIMTFVWSLPVAMVVASTAIICMAWLSFAINIYPY